MSDLFTKSTAHWSPCGLYRYDLRRVWDAALRRLAMVMLNPSTGDELSADATNVWCQRLAAVIGCGAVTFVNLFAYRATEPREMRRADDPVGPLNDGAILDACEWADQVICGWGVHGTHRGRHRAVLELLEPYDLWALGFTKDGHPRHPLYLPSRTRPQRWMPQEAAV